MASNRPQKELPTEASTDDDPEECACEPTWPCAECYIAGDRGAPAITRAADAGVDL